ncbi:Prolipoprotein diacylglyceryl transferase [Neochlamydia sp. AcF65]|uniref:prolipoprotein diacylglyceryl transferase n=1 Tax=Neochlamydia sp. AcF65 TaxID=2795735 RepID=UPI001BCA24E4|nr:prolipoprotein diacylglyceryl transferase [Neochlamydia sp. AcF65]MBS4165020.1 Prolipoprotein diacylglyceryl transferase [Neochlamydia sp. AcF65]
MHLLIAWLYWNPSKDIFTLPLVNRPIAWYGLFFVLGLILSYSIVLHLLRTWLLECYSSQKNNKDISSIALRLTDRLTWYVVTGIIIGARLGHVFFYDWPYYQYYPLDILKVWEGGLASHGGAVGILLALAIYRLSIRKKFSELTFLTLADIIALPTALAGACIRLGNFFNQEILGTPSQAPWAVIFGNPADHSLPLPRHPVQLYEAFAYLIIFALLILIWQRTHVRKRSGFMAGLFFILLFSTRFFLEFFKSSQSTVIDESTMQMGQYLSLPFILSGFFLIIYTSKVSRAFTQEKENI